VLAAKVDYETGQATIGIMRGAELPSEAIFSALKSIGYSGELVGDTL
jgi:hypothetical protein